MATLYKFDIKCTSAFLSMPKEQLEYYIKFCLENYIDPITRLKLESIEVKSVER